MFFSPGTLILLSLGFLTPTFFYIPKSSLAAVIISAVMVMIELRPLAIMWKINRMDLFSSLTTFLAAILLGMEYGIMIGVTCSLIQILVKGSKSPALNPQLRLDPVSRIQFIYAKPDHGLNFPSVDHVRESLGYVVESWPEVDVIVLSFQGWTIPPDYTVVTAVASLSQGVGDKELIFVDVGPRWRAAFASAGYSGKDDRLPVCCSYSDLSDILGRRGSADGQNVTSLASPSVPSPGSDGGECPDCETGGGDVGIPPISGDVETQISERNSEESHKPLLS